jgi:adenylate cyclase
MERKLAAIFSADVQGYSRLMGDDEEATIRTLTAYRAVMFARVEQHSGRVVDSPGDNLLAEFGSAVDAVQAALDIQTELHTRNTELPEHRQMVYRIGINVGDVVIEGERIYGDSVNIAARLESLAEGGGMCISGTVYDQIENKINVAYHYIGEQTVDNIAKPVRVYQIHLDADAASASVDMDQEQPPAADKPLALPDKPSIAVLPFLNMSSDAEQGYFSDGMTEDIITDLSKLSGLFVISRNSVFTYKDKTFKVEDVSRELGVRYVLEGSVRKAGQRMRITAQLIDATTGGHLWAERYDRELTDIFALQDEVTQQIVSALKVQLTQGEQERLGHAQTNNVEAYEYFLRGLEYHTHRAQETNVKARQMFEQAIALDPNFAAAYAWLARAHAVAFFSQWTKEPAALDQALELAQQAIALDASLPTAHETLGYVYLGKRQFAEALAESEQAVQLAPNDADAIATLGEMMLCVGRPEEAIPLIEQAMRLNPHYPASYLSSLGLSYRVTGRLEEAIPILKRVLTRNPDHIVAHSTLTNIYIELGREDEARAEAAEILRINPNFTTEGARQAWPVQDQKEVERALAALRKAGLE